MLRLVALLVALAFALVAPGPAPLLAQTPTKKDAPAKTDTKKADDAKKAESKKKAKPDLKTLPASATPTPRKSSRIVRTSGRTSWSKK